MSKKALIVAGVLAVVSLHSAFAFQVKETARYFNGPTINAVTSTTAKLSLSELVLGDLTSEEKQGVYFQYYETDLVCIAIYPTPEYCLPKKTEVGKTDITITNLKPNTSYTAVYKRDNTIRCITTPCPENGYESLSVQFKTLPNGSTGEISKDTPSGTKRVTGNLSIRSRGEQVTTLQSILIQKGYLTGEPTGYFGVVTLKAVKEFQRANNIPPTGFVGPLTRALLVKIQDVAPVAVETFEGVVTAYSTACFADGECSITVDGKKVVTTIGWSQATVGKVTGIPDFGSIEKYVGSRAKVYAKKTEDGYTLYGSEDYYIHVLGASSSKLPAGSATPGAVSSLHGITWVWNKTLVDGVNQVTPEKKGVFTLKLNEDGTLSGTTDCNSYFGTYKVGSDGVVSFGALGLTRMACENSQESVFTSYLQGVSSYNLGLDGVLTLKNGITVSYFTK